MSQDTTTDFTDAPVDIVDRYCKEDLPKASVPTETGLFTFERALIGRLEKVTIPNTANMAHVYVKNVTLERQQKLESAVRMVQQSVGEDGKLPGDVETKEMIHQVCEVVAEHVVDVTGQQLYPAEQLPRLEWSLIQFLAKAVQGKQPDESAPKV